jgi:hypothetical protein
MTEDLSMRDDAGMGGNVMCPRCKWDTRKDFLPIGDEDKKEYLRSILGGVSFTKAFPLFGGRFKVTFRDLSSTESDHVIALLRQLLSDEMLVIKAMKIKILFAVISLEQGDKKTVPNRESLGTLTTPDDALKMYDENFGTLPETLGGTLTRVYQTFSEILTRLAEGGLDENFWKGAGLD